MADVTKGFHLSVAGTQRNLAEEWVLNSDTEVHQYRPSSETVGVRKEGGLSNDNITATLVDEDYALVEELWPLRGTNVAFVARFKDAAKGATNPEITQSNGAVLKIGQISVTNGGLVRVPITLEIDGDAELTVA